jgi:hypothetical protein
MRAGLLARKCGGDGKAGRRGRRSDGGDGESGEGKGDGRGRREWCWRMHREDDDGGERKASAAK